MLPVLNSNPKCRGCSFHETANNVCIPGRPLILRESKRAILIVGDCPGFNEDEQGKIFIGKSGKLLERGYLSELPTDADVWATNAVKCSKPYKGKIKPKNVTACCAFLFEDVIELQARYEELWILCAGGPAAQAVLGVKTVSEALTMQGTTITHLPVYPEPLTKPVTVFVTYHPSFILRDPRPGKVAAVSDHLRMMTGVMNGSKEEKVEVEEVSPAEMLRRLEAGEGEGPFCIDIETYGIWKANREQTVFNPILSARNDAVPIGKQIVSVAYALRYGPKKMATTWVLHMGEKDGPNTSYSLLKAASKRKLDLLGTNMLFDLSYLKAAFPSWDFSDQRILDLCIISFIENPDRPEQSLKTLAPLLIFFEEWTKYGPKGKRYSNYAELKTYNIQDVVNPLLVYDVLMKRMEAAKMPPNPQYLLTFFSDVMTTLLHMTQHGMCIDRGELLKLGVKWSKELQTVSEESAKIGFKVCGKGSQGPINDLFKFVAGLYPEEDWERTKETKAISTGKANIYRAQVLDLPDEVQARITLLSRFRDTNKLLNSYYEPMEVYTRFGNLVFPHWFPVPSKFDSNTGLFEEGGGTRQCRVTCKGPALQTSPKVMKKLWRSRFKNGTLLSFDFNQLELRLAAFISGDAAMREEYSKATADLHHRTLCAVMGRDVDKEEEDYDTNRRKAKYVNFGIIYGITPRPLQAALWKTAKIKITLAEAEQYINGFLRGYPGIGLWHEELIRTVCKTGRLVLPITGHWLSFPPPDARGNFDKAILNFPVQGPAANIATVAQAVAIKECRKVRKGVVPLNVYDAILIDTPMPKDEAVEWAKDVEAKMADNWYVRALHEHYGRNDRFPLDAKVLSC